MKAGEYDIYISIVSPVVSQDAFGEAITTWTSFLCTFAKRTSRVGREFFEAGRVISESRVYFVIPYAPGVVPQMRVQHDAEQFEIVDVRQADSRYGPVLLECKRVQ